MMGDTVFVLPSGIAQPQVSQLSPPKWNEIKYQDTRLHWNKKWYSLITSKRNTQSQFFRGGGGGFLHDCSHFSQSHTHFRMYRVSTLPVYSNCMG